jgi:molybdenum cofactor biosynthesis enzyme MoaA
MIDHSIGNGWDRSKMVPSNQILHGLQAQYPGILPLPQGSDGTAQMYRVPGHRGAFGFISSMSNDFCGTCNRLRITADGQIKVGCRQNCCARMLKYLGLLV